MNFINNIYISSKEIDINFVKNMLKKNSYIFNTYLICIDKNSFNIAEIIHSKEVFNSMNKNKNYICIGFALGKNESFKLFKVIIMDYIKVHSTLDGFKNSFEVI